MRLNVLYIALFFPIFSYAEQENTQTDTRIVNGFDVSASDFSFVVYLEINETRCTGFVISDEYIMTAAHCVTNKHEKNTLVSINAVKVYHGDKSISVMKKNEQHLYNVSQIITHPNFDGQYGTGIPNDIALIKLNKKLTNFKIAPLADSNSQIEFEKKLSNQVNKPSSSNSHYYINPDLIGLGWGFDENQHLPDKLKQNFMATVNNELCKGSNENYNTYFCSQSYRGHVKTDTCSRDSGGPVIWKEPNGKHFVVGIVSYGSISCNASNSFYTKISAYNDFISQYITQNTTLPVESIENAFVNAPYFYNPETEGTIGRNTISFYNGAWAEVTGVLQYRMGNQIHTNTRSGGWYKYTYYDIPSGAREIMFSLHYGRRFFMRQYTVKDLYIKPFYNVSAYGTVANVWAKED